MDRVPQRQWAKSAQLQMLQEKWELRAGKLRDSLALQQTCYQGEEKRRQLQLQRRSALGSWAHRAVSMMGLGCTGLGQALQQCSRGVSISLKAVRLGSRWAEEEEPGKSVCVGRGNPLNCHKQSGGNSTKYWKSMGKATITGCTWTVHCLFSFYVLFTGKLFK